MRNPTSTKSWRFTSRTSSNRRLSLMIIRGRKANGPQIAIRARLRGPKATISCTLRPWKSKIYRNWPRLACQHLGSVHQLWQSARTWYHCWKYRMRERHPCATRNYYHHRSWRKAISSRWSAKVRLWATSQRQMWPYCQLRCTRRSRSSSRWVISRRTCSLSAR